MRVVLALLIAAVAAVDVRAHSAVEFTAPNGRHGRVENVGGGVWRLRLADADGTFSDRGAVQGLAAFMGEDMVRAYRFLEPTGADCVACVPMHKKRQRTQETKRRRYSTGQST